MEPYLSLVLPAIGLILEHQSRNFKAKLELENAGLNKEIGKIRGELVKIENESLRDKKDYEDLAKWTERRNLRFRFDGTYAVLGNKGMGKSTFLWLRGEGVRPTPSFRNGTTETIKMGSHVDTIGTSFEIESILKQVSVLLVKDTPSHVILCNGDRTERPLLALSHLFIKNVPCIYINPSRVFEEESRSFFRDYLKCYSNHMEKEHERSGGITYNHKSKFMENYNFENAMMEIFPTGTLKMQKYSEYKKSCTEGDVKPILQYKVCKNIRSLEEDFNSNSLKFLDSLSVR